MGTQGTGRKRSTKKERSTAEDDALNLIAREAEARLAAKRAARAEAREIRMKELERQQKEEDSERYSRSSRIQTLSDDDERMSVGSRGSVRVEDRDYLEKGSRAASALTAATLTSVGATSLRRGSSETALTIDAETSIREIKEIHELKDQIQDVESKYTQNLKEVKDAFVEVEEKYRKAMVSNAQLDNDKNNLMYQVDTLKDSLMELEELLFESHRGYEEKVKDHEREKHAHTVLQFQFSEMKETLKQSEELLNALERQKEYTDAIRIERDELREEAVKLKDILKKHGIVLGPDLNINGEIGEAEVDGSPSADPATQPAQDSHTAPSEGNSMLGNREDTPLRSSREEEVDPERRQEMFEEEKENPASCDALCNVAGVSTLETSSEEQPTEEQTCLKEDNVEESGLGKDLNVDNIDQSITEAKYTIICSPGLKEIVTSSEENVPETKSPKGGDLGETSHPDLGETSHPDLGETETKSSRVDTEGDEIREPCNNLFEKQENKLEEEESNLLNTESYHQQKVAQDVMAEGLPDESDPNVSNTEPQQEPENAKEAQDDEAEEISGKCQPQEAAASGKKKKRKRRGKKKGGTHEDKNQQKEGIDQEKDKKEVDNESATRHLLEPELDGSATETLKKSMVDQVKNEQDRREEAVEAAKPTETFFTNEPLKESLVELVPDEHDKEQKLETENLKEAEPGSTPKKERLDNVPDEQNKGRSSETEIVEAVEAVAPGETFSHVETLNDSRTNAKKDEGQTLETENVEEVGSITSPVPETKPSTSDLIDNSKDAESTDGLDRECSSSLDNPKSETSISTTEDVTHTESKSDSVEDEVGFIEMQSDCTTNNPENTLETSDKENTEELNVPSNGDVAADEPESTIIPESRDKASVSQSSTDVFTDALLLKSLSGSESPVAVNMGSGVASKEVLGGGPEEARAETEQESFPPPNPDGDDSEPKTERTKKEKLNEGLTDAEDLVKSAHSRDGQSDSCALLIKTTDAFDSVKSLLETVGVAQAKQLGDVQSQDLPEESNAKVSSETEKVDTIDVLNTPASPKEVTEIGSSTEQDHRGKESTVPEHPNSQKDPQSETEQLHEPGKDKSEDDDPSQPSLQDNDEEDGDEGHSFDFDDVDVEAAVARLRNPKQEEVEEGVEVMPDDRSNCSLSNENRRAEPVESIDEQGTVDGCNRVESLNTAPPDNQTSHRDALSKEGGQVVNACEKQKHIPEEEVGVPDEHRHISEGGQGLSVGGLGVVAEDIVQVASLPVEEALDAIKHELQGQDLPKRAEQVASSKEPQQTGNDVKRNSKKGKGKGKEECKMS
ncbi:titin homolog isoform X5 [Cyclopterus lumpus]|uniref:titin homolog isoform X5 n=1 Tax=Cyclopterus lumpus TaxID=8103 RepID=UPI001486A1E5|nr:titin homolog isoform X5 [Cyclopterus lumpus]